MEVRPGRSSHFAVARSPGHSHRHTVRNHSRNRPGTGPAVVVGADRRLPEEQGVVQPVQRTVVPVPGILRCRPSSVKGGKEREVARSVAKGAPLLL